MSITRTRNLPLSLLPAAVAGLGAGIGMAVVAMMATALLGMGLFAPPAMIGGIILGPDAAMAQSPTVISTGLGLHMILSMMFGIVFGLAAERLKGSLTILGAAYGLALWILNFFVLSHVSPGARAMATHEPIWLAVLTHLVFGVVLGALLARTARSRAAA